MARIMVISCMTLKKLENFIPHSIKETVILNYHQEPESPTDLLIPESCVLHSVSRSS